MKPAVAAPSADKAPAPDEPWAALDRVLAALSTAPLRTGSMIATVYGDAILARGGSLALADLLMLMRRLGASDGLVRTAVSRLTKDGVLRGRRDGRRSVYALTEAARAEFQAAIPRIYGGSDAAWDGRLRLAFPEPGADRSSLDAAGYALLAPGVLLSPWPAPEGVVWLEAGGPREAERHLVARAWPLTRLGEAYTAFIGTFSPLLDAGPVAPLDAMAGRTALIHAWRRIALRDPKLPGALLPDGWPGRDARRICVEVYSQLAPRSEVWLDTASAGDRSLPRGDDPRGRFLSGCGGEPGHPATDRG